MDHRPLQRLLLGLFLATSLAAPALAQKPADTKSAEAKPSAGPIPGVDTSKMTPTELKTLQQLIDKFPSACGRAHSLRVSLQTDPRCKRSQAAVRYLQRLLTNGYLGSEVEEKYNERYLDRGVAKINLEGAPVRGNPKAPITIVEFSDFECPSCKAVEPVLKKILEQNADVKLVFLNFPLPMHQNAGPAAAAAIAAGKQGKFWAYHDKLFENQGHQTAAELIAYAQELKLDVARFQADMEAARARVAQDRSQGEGLKLTGTPSLFINGRAFNEPRTVEAINAWLDEERGK